MRNFALVMCLILLVPGCAPISKEVKATLERPVDCNRAEQDIATLEKERASVVKRVAHGASAVTPAGAVIGILTLTQADKLAVATGEYNKMLDAKIEQIKDECGLK